MALDPGTGKRKPSKSLYRPKPTGLGATASATNPKAPISPTVTVAPGVKPPIVRPAVLRKARNLIRESIYSKRPSSEVGKELAELQASMTATERKRAKAMLDRMSKEAEKKRVQQFETMGSFAVGEFSKLIPGGTPASEIDPKWAAVDTLGLFPFGKGARAARLAKLGDKPATAKKAAALTPEETVVRAMGPARKAAAEQKKLYRAERARRFGNIEEAVAKTDGGREGYRAAVSQLKGELPKVRFDKLSHLDDETIDALLTTVQQHPALRTSDKLNLQGALLRAWQGDALRPFEIKLIENAFGAEAASVFKSGVLRKLGRAASEVVNLPRSLLATADLSAPFRQGLLAGAANPRIFAKNLGPMFKMFASEKRFGQIMEEIAARPTYQTMVDARLALTELGELSVREEQFMSNLAEKIPVAGRVVRASSRAYVGFLNRMRADLFDHLVDVARSQGIETPKLRRDVARFVNVATGRGGLWKLEGAAVALNSTLFAPRLFASRVAALNPVWYATLDPFARKQAVLATTKLIGGGMSVLTLAWLAGAKVNTDPRNANFGKIRLGNTRFDIWGGHTQLVRVFEQVRRKEIVSSTTGEVMRLEGGYKLGRDDITLRFFENKLAPSPSLIWDWFQGTDFEGRPFSWKRAAAERTWPLVLQDAVEVYQEYDSPWKAAASYGVSAFGIGAQTYGPKEKKESATRETPSRSRRSKSLYRGSRRKSKSLYRR